MPKPNISSGRTRITTTLKSSLLLYARLRAASMGVTLNSVIEDALLRLYNAEPHVSSNIVEEIENKLIMVTTNARKDENYG